MSSASSPRLGHLCDDYVTINEPNVYALNGYRDGIWPPGKKNLKSAMRAMSVMASAHIRAYRLIHRLRREMGLRGTRVGVALHMRSFAPKNRANPRTAPPPPWPSACSRR